MLPGADNRDRSRPDGPVFEALDGIFVIPKGRIVQLGALLHNDIH